MKTVNIMNFVRQIDERNENSTENLLDLTTKQMHLVKEYGVDATFLLQYDVLCDSDFVSMFKKEVTDKIELGLWYEIVEPMTSACNIPYRSEEGWKWDWHIIPGFSMAYTPAQREQLIDEAMRKFKEVFGYYPKSIASWLIDTHTLNYLSEHYDVSAAAICRDQANTDAYTLLGGYFNQAYFPSKNNIFTPAQQKEMQTDIPVFRLLSPSPIHNYDEQKYCSDEFASNTLRAPYTLEPYFYMGSNSEAVDWMFDCYYSEESLGFAYAQIGQENSFYKRGQKVLDGTRMQIEKLLRRADVSFMKMRDTGEAYKRFSNGVTPATSVVAMKNFDSVDVQSVYYDCKNYTANLFRYGDRVFLRSLYLFDERKKEHYLEETCTTFDAVYENLPIVDTKWCEGGRETPNGLIIETAGKPFEVSKLSDGVLKITFGEGHVIFYEGSIEIKSKKMTLFSNSVRGKAVISDTGLVFNYKDSEYALMLDGGKLTMDGDNIIFTADTDLMTLSFNRIR